VSSVSLEHNFLTDILTGNAFLFFLDYAPLRCSGHGVVVTGDLCLCDLGYTGSQCSETASKYHVDDII
jgi:hypothetical protein